MSKIVYEVTVYPNGTQEWFLNGKRHREDGPAVIDVNGYQAWCRNGVRHREDGPAVIRGDGTQEYWLNGKYHREDGPAVIYEDGSQEWYLNGKRFTKEQWEQRVSPCVNKTVTIDGKEYRLTPV